MLIIEVQKLNDTTIKRIEDELFIVKIQNKFRHLYIEKLFNDHYAQSPDFDVSKEKEYIADELKKWWKHRKNSEIDKMIEQFYISNSSK